MVMYTLLHLAVVIQLPQVLKATNNMSEKMLATWVTCFTFVIAGAAMELVRE